MSRDFFYCSELSRQAAEKIYGTASTGQVWLLLEYPFAWGPQALHDSALSPTLKDFLNQTIKSVPRSRFLFIKQERACGETVSFFVVRAREREPFIVRFDLSHYDQLAEIDIASVAAGKSLAAGSRRVEPLFLVCTHGKRDKCCAKFGYPLYKSLREQAGDAVWQSSHVGGDRFAANLICFPHGLFYAHVTTEAGRAIIGEYRERRVLLEKYRGRACYANPSQAAEFFIRAEADLRGVDDLRHLGCERTDAEGWRVRFLEKGAGITHEATLAYRESDFRSFITCGATEPKRVAQYILADYRAQSASAP